MRRGVLAGVAALLLAGPALAEDKKKGDKKKDDGGVIELPPTPANVRLDSGALGVMTVDLNLAVPDPALHDLADSVQPRLRDAYASALQAYASRLAPGTAPDADYIARELQKATDRVLGRRGATLLLGGIMIN